MAPFRNFLSSSPSTIFITIRHLHSSVRPYGYEVLVLRAIKYVVMTDIFKFPPSLKEFIIHNCISIASVASRSYVEFRGFESIFIILIYFFLDCRYFTINIEFSIFRKLKLNVLLNEWSIIFERLMEIDELITSQLCFVVFDVFLNDFIGLLRRLQYIPIIVTIVLFTVISELLGVNFLFFSEFF